MNLKSIATILLGLALCVSALAQTGAQKHDDQPMQLKNDVAGESLGAFLANHPDAKCDKKIDRTQSCYSFSGFTLLGFEFKPKTGCSMKSSFDLGCINGYVQASFFSDKLSWIAYDFQFMVGFGDKLADAISEKYGRPSRVSITVGTPDPIARNGRMLWCAFPLDKEHAYSGLYQWENGVSRIDLSCANDSLNNHITLYLKDDGSKKDF